MLNSLRFRLPALFLAGIALSGLVTSLIALRLFQDYTRTASLNELRREAQRARAALRRVGRAGRRRGEGGARPSRPSKLEAATGDRLYFVGTSLSPGEDSGLTRDHAHGRRRRSLDDADRHLRVQAAGAETDVPRGRAPDPAGRRDRVRLPDRREAEGRAARRLGDAALAARDRVPLLARGRGRARLLPHAQDHRARARPLGRGRRGLRGATTTSRCRASPAAARSATSPTASAR